MGSNWVSPTPVTLSFAITKQPDDHCSINKDDLKVMELKNSSESHVWVRMCVCVHVLKEDTFIVPFMLKYFLCLLPKVEGRH